VLYGTGIEKRDKKSGEMDRTGGVKLTIKDGIIYDAKALLSDVRKMVEDAKK